VRLGLTGGIGSGKSTVSALFSHMGAWVIDADAISRTVTATHGSAIAPLKAIFGATILTLDGALDRKKMRSMIYANGAVKAQLENIIHPLVQHEMDSQSLLAESENASCIVFDIPLLVESRYWRNSLHKILVIDCTESTQMARVMQRDGLSETEAAQIMSAQATRDERLRTADLVLFNDGINTAQLSAQVREFGARFGL